MLAFVVIGVIILVGFVFLMYKIVDYKKLYLQFKTLYDDLVLVVRTKLEVEINTLNKNVIDLTTKLNLANTSHNNLVTNYNALIESKNILQFQFDELYDSFNKLDNLFTQYKKYNPIKQEESFKEQMDNLSTTDIGIPTVNIPTPPKKKRTYKNNPNLKLQG